MMKLAGVLILEQRARRCPVSSMSQADCSPVKFHWFCGVSFSNGAKKEFDFVLLCCLQWYFAHTDDVRLLSVSE